MKSKKNFGIFFFMLISISISFNSFVYTKETNYVFQFINDGYSSPNENLIEGNYDILNEKWSDINSLTLKGMKHFYDLGSKMRTFLVKKFGILDYNYNNRQIKTLNFERKNSILASYLLLVGLFPPLDSEKMTSDQVKFSESSYDYYKSDMLYDELSLNSLPNGIEVYPIKSFHPENKIYGLANPNKCPGIQKIMDHNGKNKKSTLKILDHFANIYKNELNKLNWKYSGDLAHEKLIEICNAYSKGYLDNRKFEIFQEFYLDKKQLFKDCSELENNFIYEDVLGDEHRLVARLSNTRSLKNLFGFLDKKIEAIIFEDNLNFYLQNVKEKKFDKNKPYEKQFSEYADDNEKAKHARAKNLNKEEMLERYSLFSGSKMDMGSFMSFLNFTFNSTIFPIEESSTIFFQLVQNKTLLNLQNSDKDVIKNKFFTEEDFEIYIFFNREKIVNMSYNKFKNLAKANFIAEDFINDFCKFEYDDSLLFEIISILLFVICCILAVCVIKLWMNYNKRNEKKRLLSEEYENEYEEDESSSRSKNSKIQILSQNRNRNNLNSE